MLFGKHVCFLTCHQANRFSNAIVGHVLKPLILQPVKKQCAKTIGVTTFSKTSADIEFDG